MRATTEIEKVVTGGGNKNKKGGSKAKKTMRNAIIVTELPYQTNKAAMLEKIAKLVNERKLDGIADLRDESDRDGIRVVIELKRDAVASVVLNNLYKKTQLQSTFSGNFLALMTKTTTKGSTPTGDSTTTSNNSDKDDEESDTNAAATASSAALVPQRFTLRQALDCFLDFRFETIRRMVNNYFSHTC